MKKSQMFTGEEDFVNFLINKQKAPRGTLGIGDDAAIFKGNNKNWAITTDSLIENVHFHIRWATPRYLGKLSALSNISDLSAMGARPHYSLVSLVMPPECMDKVFVTHLYNGFSDVFADHDCYVIGGNVSKGSILSITLTLLGTCQGKPLTRGRAAPGDILMITGSLGGHAAEIFQLLGKFKKQATHIPASRSAFAQLCAMDSLLTSAIDISDGLARDLTRLCQTSRVGAVMYEKQIPIATEAQKIANNHHASTLTWALEGGEDYELLCTVSPKNLENLYRVAKKTHTPLSIIGKIIAGEHLQFVDAKKNIQPLHATGWDHLSTLTSQ